MRDHHEVEFRPIIDLSQWVVKGTAKNRGKYLKREWYPPRATWKRMQDAADRFSHTDAEFAARAYGGTPVRLVAPRRILTQVPMLREFIFEHAQGAAERKVLHWIHGVGELPKSRYVEGDCFCLECATKTVEELCRRYPKRAGEVNLCVDGGWGQDEDGPRYCELCQAPLQHSLTDYGVEEEFNHFTEHQPAANQPEEWAAVSMAVENLPEDSPLWSFVATWVSRAKAHRPRARR